MIEKHKVTHAAFLAPTMLRRVVDERRGRTPPSLRSIVVGGAPLHQEDLRDTVGLIGPIRIADTGGEPVPDGADGEVLVRADVVMRSYWENPDATAATLAGGWLHTGDIGHLDSGFLYLTDRAKGRHHHRRVDHLPPRGRGSPR